MSSQEVRLRTRDLSVSPPREGVIVKQSLAQAVLSCRELSFKHEYIDIEEIATCKIYTKDEILKMIQELSKK
jgi:hypothetical protein